MHLFVSVFPIRIRMDPAGYACMDPDTHAWIRIHFASWSRIRINQLWIRNTEEERKVDVEHVFKHRPNPAVFCNKSK